MRNVVIHHTDPDGFGAAYAAWKRFGSEAEYYSWNYHKPINMDLIAAKKVLILDFSFDRQTMEEIANKAQEVLLLDHHATAKKEIGDLPYCKFSETMAGCTFTWATLFPKTTIPKMLQYIEDRDLWKFSLPHSKEINAAISSYPFDFSLWDGFVSMGDRMIETFYMEGKPIIRHIDSMVKMLLGRRRLITVGKIRVEAVNTRVYMSEVANELAKTNPFGVTYHDTEDCRIYNLRSNQEQFDVGELARSLGGGGHKTASGFEVPL